MGVINYSNSKPKSIDLSKSFIEEFKGSVINIDINEHDSYIGLVETMPYLLSSVLIKLSHKSSSWKEVFRYFDGKFNEFSSPSEIDPIKSFSSISTNNDMINQWIKLYINELMNLEKQIESNSERKLLILLILLGKTNYSLRIILIQTSLNLMILSHHHKKICCLYL